MSTRPAIYIHFWFPPIITLKVLWSVVATGIIFVTPPLFREFIHAPHPQSTNHPIKTTLPPLKPETQKLYIGNRDARRSKLVTFKVSVDLSVSVCVICPCVKYNVTCDNRWHPPSRMPKPTQIIENAIVLKAESVPESGGNTGCSQDVSKRDMLKECLPQPTTYPHLLLALHSELSKCSWIKDKPLIWDVGLTAVLYCIYVSIQLIKSWICLNLWIVIIIWQIVQQCK